MPKWHSIRGGMTQHQNKNGIASKQERHIDPVSE